VKALINVQHRSAKDRIIRYIQKGYVPNTKILRMYDFHLVIETDLAGIDNLRYHPGAHKVEPLPERKINGISE